MEPQGSLMCSCQPSILILSQMNPIQNVPFYFPKIHSNIIFPSTPRSSEWLFPSGFQTKILYAFLISPMRSTFPAYFIFLDLVTIIIFGEAYKLWSSSLCSLLQPPSTSSLLSSNNPLSALSLCSLLSVRDQLHRIGLWAGRSGF
jgi:hypothetical protein